MSSITRILSSKTICTRQLMEAVQSGKVGNMKYQGGCLGAEVVLRKQVAWKNSIVALWCLSRKQSNGGEFLLFVRLTWMWNKIDLNRWNRCCSL
jgi:hypothetical protein